MNDVVRSEDVALFWRADWWELELFEDSSPSLEVWDYCLNFLLGPVEWVSVEVALVSVREYPLGRRVVRKSFCWSVRFKENFFM